MKQKVVVIGHGYTSRLSIIRSVGMAGYDVDVVVVCFGDPRQQNKPLDCHSKYVDKVWFSPSGDEDALVELLLEKYSQCKQKPVLIPESDFSVKAVDSNLDRLKDYFLIPNIDGQQGAVTEWMNKLKQKERAKSVGLNVADYHVIPIRQGKFEIPDDITYPCFPKSIDGGKTGLGKCNNRSDLTKSLRQMAEVRADRDVLVEEYLEIDKEYALVGFSDGNRVCIPAILYNETMAKGAHYGIAKGGRVLPVTNYRALVEQFETLMASIRFVGIFDIDFLECQGKFYFDEINLRFGGSGYAVTKSGANLPAMFADFMTTGKCAPIEVLSSTNLTFVNERICIDEWYAGNTKTRDFRKEINSANISFINDEQDPEPYRMFEKYYAQQKRKRTIRILLSRLKLK